MQISMDPATVPASTGTTALSTNSLPPPTPNAEGGGGGEADDESEGTA
jgi:hypothetical protein